MLKTGLCLLMCLIAGTAWGQEWQHYQLTDFPPPGQVRECSSVADSFGHVHHYFRCLFNPIYVRHEPLFYMRTDFYGNILTDTVRLNDFAGDYPAPRCVKALGDGTHSWCVFGERVSPEEELRGLFLAERDENGQEVIPPTFLGYDGAWESDNTSAVLDHSDGTIHVVGTVFPCYYYRFTTSAETLQWRRPINGLLMEGLNTSLILSPADGRPWASMVTVDGQGGGHMLVVRFNEDTSQTVYLPLQGQLVGIGHDGFGMDAEWNIDCHIGTDTVEMGYARIDSTFQTILDYQTLCQNVSGFTTLRTDPLGNCLNVWSTGAYGLYWAYRRASGEWMPPPTAINSEMELCFFSIVTMDSSRFAFTATGIEGFEDYQQLRLYTYGFPPNDATSPKPISRYATMTAYPNPFGSSLQLSLPGLRNQTIILYDLLGRTVWSYTVPSGVRHLKVNDPQLGELPSGTYFLALRGHSQIVPLHITHSK